MQISNKFFFNSQKIFIILKNSTIFTANKEDWNQFLSNNPGLLMLLANIKYLI